MYQVLLLSALLSSPTAPPSSSAQDAAGGERFDHDLFFAPIREIVERAAGSRFAYRFRRVGNECGADQARPTLIWDGLTRIEFAADGIWLDEVHYEMAAEKVELPTVRRVATFFSLSSGEYARSTSLAGGGEPNVVLDHWSSLPQLAYFALGLISSDAYLDGCEPMALAVDDDGVALASCSNASGARLTLGYDMQSGGQVRYVRADHPDGREHDWIQFHDCVPYLAGGPLRPTLVTLARIDDGGCVGQVFAWSAISGTWAEEEWQLVAPAGSMVLDYRCADGAVSDVRTDRPVRLDELLSWPYRYEAEPTDAPVTFVLNHAPPGEKRAGLSWWLGFGVAFVLVAIGMKRSRS